MDPSISIDLKSIAGIVALTIGIVNFCKGWLGQQPVLRDVPIFAYVMFVSVVLTLVVHQFTPWLPGDAADLVWQALAAAFVASGAREAWNAGLKPAAATEAARAARNGGLPLLLIILLGAGAAGCAKVTPQLLAGEKTVRASVLQAANTVEPIVCNAEARKVLTAAPCLKLLDALEPAIDLAIAYNRALREGKPPAVAPTIQAFDRLIDAIRQVVPDGPAKTAAIEDVVLARVRAEGGR